MADPYTSVTVTNYNANPPADDGSAVPANRVNWSKHKEKLGDPLKTAVESIDTNVGSAVDKLAGGTTAVSGTYTILTGDQGKTVVSSDGGTITTPDATSVTSPFEAWVLNNSSATMTVDGSGAQTIDGQTNITLPPGAGAKLTTDGTNWFTGGRGRIQGASSYVSPYMRGHLGGCQMAVAADADHDITIAIGSARDTADSFNFDVASAITKQIDASWAAGSAAGGMASGVSLDVDTWYHLFLVDNGSGGTDAGFDTSVTATNLLATSGVGTKYRRIGSVLTDGSANINEFTQRGDWVYFSAPPHDLDANTSVSPANIVISTPLGIRVMALLSVVCDGVASTGTVILFSSPDMPAVEPSIANGVGSIFGGGQPIGGQVTVWTDTSSQVRWEADDDTRPTDASTLGWFDRRGRDD